MHKAEDEEEGGDAEVPETNKFGPIVELLQTFTDAMVDPSRLMQDEEGEVVAPDGTRYDNRMRFLRLEAPSLISPSSKSCLRARPALRRPLRRARSVPAPRSWAKRRP